MSITNLSVILPVYNGMPFLKEAITSVLNQSYQNFIIYVIDNGSEDGTGEYLNQINDSRINYVRLEEKKLVKALNTGLELTNTPFIARMDADDIIHQLKFEKQMKYLKENRYVDLIGTLGQYISIDGNKHFNINLPVLHTDIIESMLKSKNAFIHPSIMFRKRVIDLFGGYDQNYYPSEDYEFFLRIGNRIKFANIPERLHSMRVSKNSVISTNMKSSRKKYYLVSNLYSKNYGSYNPPHFKTGLAKKLDTMSLVVYRKGLYYYLNVSLIIGVFNFIIASLLNPFRLIQALKSRMTIKD